MADDQQPTPAPAAAAPPAAIPWYKSAVLRGILVCVIAQIGARVKAKYHIDFEMYGVTADSAAQWVLDTLSAAAIAYAAHGRVARPLPIVTRTRAAAAAINQSKSPG